MFKFLKKQWFLIGIAAATLLAFLYPSWGNIFHDYDIFNIGIFLAFLTTGLGLETRNVFRQVKNITAPVAALLSSLILYPVIAWLIAMPVLPHEFVIGICIIAREPCHCLLGNYHDRYCPWQCSTFSVDLHTDKFLCDLYNTYCTQPSTQYRRARSTCRS